MGARICLAALASLVVVGLVGCGGGGASPPPGSDASVIEGRVSVAGDAGGYDLLLDGQPVPGALRPDGSYAIEGVAPGRHRVAAVSRDGMTGGYATVEVPPGTRTRAPEIVPELGGQIVGIVTVRDEQGLRALAGVEVTAQPAVVLAVDEDDSSPDVWPPIEDPLTFTTFTDENGSYLLRAVPGGEYVVTVAAPEMMENWQWVWVEAGRTAVADFELRPQIQPGVGTVQGQVVGVRAGASEPLVGARVTVSTQTPWEPEGPVGMPARPAQDDGGEEGEGGGSEPGLPDPDLIVPPWFDSFSTLTGPDGSYVLNVPAGYATIEVYMPGWEPAWEEIAIRAGETLEKSFRLQPWEIEPPQPPVPGPLPDRDGQEG
ncbi:MAG: carboxypeptidase regulatory-like domain-containing protein [Armatimonadota bacterium]